MKTQVLKNLSVHNVTKFAKTNAGLTRQATVKHGIKSKKSLSENECFTKQLREKIANFKIYYIY